GRGTGPKTGGLESAFKSHDQPICYPTLTRASVVLSAAAQASGGTPLASNPEVSYHSTFVDHGFNSAANKGNLYLEILGTGPALNFSGASSGGVITPNLSLTRL